MEALGLLETTVLIKLHNAISQKEAIKPSVQRKYFYIPVIEPGI